MLYLTQRYLLGVFSLAFLVMAAIIFLPTFQPDSFPNLLVPETFVPMMDLFIVSGAMVGIMAVASAHPLVTDGKETLYMSTPLSHPGIHAIILMTLVVGGMYLYMDNHYEDNWRMERRLESCLFLLQICLASALTILVSFFVLRAKARERAKLKRLNREARRIARQR